MFGLTDILLLFEEVVLFKDLRSFSNFDFDLVIILTCLSKIILVCGRKKTPSGKDELSLFTFKLIFLQSNS
mgnify:FL=1